jgi:(3,5-dihydroxyphenyl)acetyl-CoA 1,2-dioxygenase
MDAARQLNQTDRPVAPPFNGTLAQDAKTAADFFNATPATPEARAHLREVKEAFFRRHAAAMYAELTAGHACFLRVSELVYSAAELFPLLLPTRAQIAAERTLQRQSAKQGLEVDQGFFIAHVLADAAAGNHLIRAMLLPKPEAEARIGDFRKTGVADLGGATVERKGRIGQVCLTNPKFINAEDDAATAALETAIDLVLLDENIDAGVLRGGLLDHPKYKDRRVFNAGINLTHLYYGQISFIEFIIERELGLLNKIYRGHTRKAWWDAEIEDYAEKPWLAAVESFAIGGGCQLLCVMDRVIAEPDAYFNLPASKEGFIPGAANLRLPRLVGIQTARHGIFFDKKFHAGTPEGMTLCDEVVPAGQMEEAIARNTTQMLRAGFTSAVSNRKALRAGQEPLATYRRYLATYSRQQALCMYDQTLINNLKHSWQPERRRM